MMRAISFGVTLARFAGVGLLAGCAVDEADDQIVSEVRHPLFTLEEEVSWPLDDPVSVTGGVVSDSGWAMLMTTDELIRILPAPLEGEPPTWVHVQRTGPMRLLAVESGGNYVKAVAGETGEVVHIYPDGKVRSTGVMCPALRTTESMIHVGDTVIGVVPHGVGGRSVLLAAVMHEWGCYILEETELRCSIDSPTVVQGGVEWTAIIACASLGDELMGFRAGHGILSIPSSRAPVRDHPTRTDGLELPPLWHALPLIAIDGGYLRVVADRRSDLRRFELWSPVGVHLRTTTAIEPVGLFAGSASGKMVLGMRGAQAFEVVTFRVSRTER